MVTAMIDRATHLVEQLLVLARLDPQAETLQLQPQNIRPILEEVLAEQVPAALEKGITLTLHGTESCLLSCNPVTMQILVRNLVDNAICYTPAQDEVQVVLSQQDDRILVTVHDSGKGIDEALRQTIFDRFQRGDQQNIKGCGLGLSIVHRITELHHAHISLLDSHLGGLQVEVCFAENTP